MNLEELEAHLIELKSKQMNTRGVLRKLLQIHCRNRNVERALQIKKVNLPEAFMLFLLE
jgi:leucine-rich PPR motif-containing protein, mitochondrial